MKKILFIITQSELGGAQKHVLDLAVAFKDRYEVLVAAGPDGAKGLFDKLYLAHVKNVHLRWLRRAINPLHDLMAIWEIGGLLLREKPQIVHLHSSKAGFLGTLATKFFRPRAKIIYTSHGAAFNASFPASNKKLFLWIEKLSAPLKNRIICVSSNEKNSWVQNKVAPEEKLTVIPNGLDLKALTKILPKDEAKKTLAEKNPALSQALTGQGQPIKIVGTIANFYPDKGLPYFIEAASLSLKQIGPKSIFVVIGDGPERPLYQKMIEDYQLKNLFFLFGAMPDAINYLKAFDVYVQPSLKEGFGYSVLEAMAAGLPIVASHVGGIPEMIKNNANGFLLFPRDTASLAKKIQLLLNDPLLCQKFSATSQERVKEFSLEKMVAATEKVYLE